MLLDLVKKTRSCRRFKQDIPISRQELLDLVNLARLGASASNIQPLKYMLSYTPAEAAAVFPHTAWASHYKDWSGPEAGERPAAYIIILGDQDLTNNYWCDHGIAAQNIVLGATEKGLGSCIIGAFNAKGLRRNLQIPERYDILLIIALGTPAETIILETVTAKQGIKYWRDNEGAHHVPKRSLEELLVEPAAFKKT